MITIDEALEECQRRYQDGDEVRCVHMIKDGSKNVYEVVKNSIKIMGTNYVVADDKKLRTTFIVLYNANANVFAPKVRVKEITLEEMTLEFKEDKPKAPHRTDMVAQVINILTEMDKYNSIGTIVGSLQRERVETLLDIQLRNFKERKEEKNEY